MRRFVLACAVALCGPAFGNEREDSEAKLAALAGPVIAALGAAMPQVEGMTCTPAAPDPSPTNRLILPNWRADCRWTEGGRDRHSNVVLFLSESGAESARHMIAETAVRLADGSALPGTQVFGEPDPRAALLPHELKAAPGKRVGALATVPRGGDELLPPPGTEALAAALAAMDVTALEAMNEVAQHGAALADHRTLLEAQRAGLEVILRAAIADASITPLPSGKTFYPDFMFFGAEPLVQTSTVETGVALIVTLTTSSFALENAFADKQFVGRHKNGETGKGGVFHDRGRVQVYLRDNSMTALIDGRGMLMLYVPDEGAGTDPVAAMEAVLARISANDFSGY